MLDAAPDDPLTSLALAVRDGDPDAASAFVTATQPEVWRLAVAPDRPPTRRRRHRGHLPARVPGPATVRRPHLAAHHRPPHLRRPDPPARQGPPLDATIAAQPGTTTAPDHGGALTTADLLRQLPQDQQVAFTLTQILGLTYAEAAEVESVPIGTIRSRVARARDQLVTAHKVAQAS